MDADRWNWLWGWLVPLDDDEDDTETTAEDLLRRPQLPAMYSFLGAVNSASQT